MGFWTRCSGLLFCVHLHTVGNGFIRVSEANPMDWAEQARCQDEDPDLFFPIGESPESIEMTRQAKAICGMCGVRDQCLEWALENDQALGIWGGLSEIERRGRLQRGRRNERLIQEDRMPTAAHRS